MDAQDRRFDDVAEGIDWDEIIATTQEDCDAGRCRVFKSTDYSTDESLIEAMARWTDYTLGRQDKVP